MSQHKLELEIQPQHMPADVFAALCFQIVQTNRLRQRGMRTVLLPVKVTIELAESKLDPAQKQALSHATVITKFHEGALFESPLDVETFFNRENLVTMLGADRFADVTQDDLNLMAEAVILSRTHCAF